MDLSWDSTDSTKELKSQPPSKAGGGNNYQLPQPPVTVENPGKFRNWFSKVIERKIMLFFVCNFVRSWKCLLITIWCLDLRFSEDHMWYIYIYICVTVASVSIIIYSSLFWGDRLGKEMTFRICTHDPKAFPVFCLLERGTTKLRADTNVKCRMLIGQFRRGSGRAS